MLIRGDLETIKKDFTAGGPDFTIMNAGEFVADEGIEESVTRPLSPSISLRRSSLFLAPLMLVR